MKKQRTADLKTIVFNIVRLQARKMENGTTTRLRFSCVITRDNITHIGNLARLALLLGIEELQLTEAVHVDNPRMPDRLAAMNDDEAVAFARSVIDAARTLLNTKTRLVIQETLKDKLAPTVIALETGQVPVSPSALYRREDTTVKASPCMQAWNTVVVVADGSVRPCCGNFEPIGDAKTQPLAEIVDGPKARAFRQLVLDGGPDIPCATCHMATTRTREALENEIRAERRICESRRAQLLGIPAGTS